MEVIPGLTAEQSAAVLAHPVLAERRKEYEYFDYDIREIFNERNSWSAEGMAGVHLAKLHTCGRSAQILRALWDIGVPAKLLGPTIRQEWWLTPRHLVKAFGDDIDDLFREAGFRNRLPPELTVWRGGSGPIEHLAAGMSWTRRYPCACAFALNTMGEPLVIKKTIKRSDVLAYFARTPEKEIVVAKACQAIAEIDGDPRHWQRHRAWSKKKR